MAQAIVSGISGVYLWLETCFFITINKIIFTTFSIPNVLHVFQSGKQQVDKKISNAEFGEHRPFLKQFDFWMTFDLVWGHLKICS